MCGGVYVLTPLSWLANDCLEMQGEVQWRAPTVCVCDHKQWHFLLTIFAQEALCLLRKCMEYIYTSVCSLIDTPSVHMMFVDMYAGTICMQVCMGCVPTYVYILLQAYVRDTLAWVSMWLNFMKRVRPTNHFSFGRKSAICEKSKRDYPLTAVGQTGTTILVRWGCAASVRFPYSGMPELLMASPTLQFPSSRSPLSSEAGKGTCGSRLQFPSSLSPLSSEAGKGTCGSGFRWKYVVNDVCACTCIYGICAIWVHDLWICFFNM